MPDYVTRHKAEWTELETLIERARRASRSLGPEDLGRLDVLYRRVTVHLAQVSTRTSDVALIDYLNGLAAAAHSLIYLPPRENPFRRFGSFVAEGFARAVARTWRYHLASLLLMVCGGGAAYVAAMRDPAAVYAILPSGESRLPGSSPEQLREILRSGRDQGSAEKFMFASFLFSHNLKVGVLSLVAGVLAGVPTILLIIYNGMILGAFSAVHHADGIYMEYWAWILPHGVSELGAIVLCGGSGLALGRAVISPGLMTREESLLRAGREAALVTSGVAFMLLVAALAESYLRQSHLSSESRLAFAGASLLVWTAYFARGAHLERRAARESDAGVYR